MGVKLGGINYCALEQEGAFVRQSRPVSRSTTWQR